MADRLPKEEFVRTGLAAAFAVLGLYVCYLLALPFVGPLTWAVVLSILIAPFHRRLEDRLRHPSLAAMISTIAAASVVAVPVLFVAQQLIGEAAKAAIFIEKTLRSSAWREAIADSPHLSAIADWVEQRLDLAGAAANLAAWLTGRSTSFLRASATQLLGFVLTLYFLFFLLRDRVGILRVLGALSPLSPAETRLMGSRFAETVDATIFGVIVIAAIQGTLGGLMFWWLGLPLPVVWGLVMGLLAIVPVLGAFVVWIPASLFLALDGSWAKAIILAAWGGLIVAGIDNLLYPMLVGNRLKLHTIPALIGAIGGIMLFGASGLVLGPASIVLTWTLVDILKSRYAAPAAAEGPTAAGSAVEQSESPGSSRDGRKRRPGAGRSPH
ncbi:MAG TPA: AI-2E family transporter [Rhizobiales bacterium]|nr:AI-2E family transporter [Hyphomicrobiales bacterium]